MDMSSSQENLSEPPQHGRPLSNYSLNEEERKVLLECKSESFWYRSVPFSIISMLTTQALIQRGKLTTSTRFGAAPKLAFAAIFGFVAGKFSYIGECNEKFLKLENSPVAEIMRQKGRTQQRFPQPTDHPSEFSYASVKAPLQTFAPVAAEPPSSVYSSKYESGAAEVPFSASMSESSPTGIEDRVSVAPEPILEAPSKQKAVTYDELRDQNRDLYHKAGGVSPRAPVQERRPWKESAPVKKNKYGDVWEE